MSVCETEREWEDKKKQFLHMMCDKVCVLCWQHGMRPGREWELPLKKWTLFVTLKNTQPQSGSVKKTFFSWFVGNHETDGMIINDVSPAWVKGLMLWNVLHLMMNINYIYLHAYTAHKFLAVCVCMVQLRWSLNCVQMQFLLNPQPLWDHPVILF